jgi:hypothetical protein
VKAYAIGASQHDPLTVKKFVNMLMNSGVEVHQSRSQFIAGDRLYGPGSFVVTMAQPKQALVRWMLGRTLYPDNSYTRDRDGNPIPPYDLATDVFSEFMGVRADPVAEPIAADLVKLTAPVPMTGAAAANAAGGHALSAKWNDTYRAVNLLLENGVAVHRVARASAGLAAGDFVVTGGSAGLVADVARQTGVDFKTAAGVPQGAYEIRKPRIAMYQRYGGGNMDEGWTRLLFEQFNVPSKPVRDTEIKAGGLDAMYDVIVLPNDSLQAMVGSASPAGGEPAGGAAPPADTTPPEYRNNGFGADGVKALLAFVDKGGTLVTFGQAGDLPIQRFGLPLRNVVQGLPSKAFWAPGSTLRVKFDTTNHIAYGMPGEGLALFTSGSQVYEITSTSRSQDVEVIATYADRDILQSGWLLGEQVIARKAAAVTVKQGAGKVVLLGFRPQHRDQTHGTFKLVFNALLNGPR